ncbi:MAG TPA: 50S ribosomal protein L9 [Lentisphaeria bacterium]|nr:50S ribosomal protein L9 [Lentisphaeria bacterium]
MSVELILLDNIEHLGNIGDQVRVAPGYARNYLMPRGLATKASPGTLRQLESRKKIVAARMAAEMKEWQAVAERIQAHSVSIPVQADDDEHLYGSVTQQQIVDAFKDIEVNLQRRQVALGEPIRALGVYTVEIHLHPEVRTEAKVWVVRA